MREMRIVVVLGFWLAWSGPVRADGLRYDYRLEDGFEYDSNPARTETIDGAPLRKVPGSVLARVVASGSLVASLLRNNVLAMSGAFGGKWFQASSARAENVLVLQGTATDSQRLMDKTKVGLALSYYDVFQRRSRDLPDFRSLAPTLRLDQGLGTAFSASLGGGYRWFTFKPDDAYGFSAPTAFFSLRHLLPGDVMQGQADWEWSIGGSLESRAFHGPACTSSGCTSVDGGRHHDRFWIGHAEFNRTGGWLFGSGFAMHINQSNSYGESLVRALFHVRAVVPLPWDLSLSLRGELVATRYADPLTFLKPVAGLPSASIEDESRSTLRVELARLFEGRFEVGARYVYYTSAPASGSVEFRRQTALVYLAFLDEN
jgi:hypothetical protein